MMRFHPLIPALFLALGTQTALATGMYKWTDAQGQVHYTQSPPPTQSYKSIAPPPGPASSPPSTAADSQPDQTTGKQSKPKADKTPDPAQQAKAEAQRKQNCEAAHHNLTVLTSGGRRRFVGPDGVAYYMKEEDRQAKIAEAKKQIADFCN